MGSDDELAKRHSIERQKTIRMALWVVLALIAAAVLFGVYRFVTAPVRAVENTTQTISRQVEETATAVLTRRHVRVAKGREFSTLADQAHRILVNLPETRPQTLEERVFRAAHLRGSQNKLCRFDMDFGAGAIPVWAAADNADFTANRDLGGEAERQIRIVFDTNDITVGVSVQYEAQAETPLWQLLWRRRDSLNKPLTDATISARTLSALAAVADHCGAPAP